MTSEKGFSYAYNSRQKKKSNSNLESKALRINRYISILKLLNKITRSRINAIIIGVGIITVSAYILSFILGKTFTTTSIIDLSITKKYFKQANIFA